LVIPYNRLFIFVIGALLFAGCGNSGDQQASQTTDEVKQKVSQFSLTQARGGNAKWKLDARTASFLEYDRVRIEGVDLLVYGDKGKETAQAFEKSLSKRGQEGSALLKIHGERGEVNLETNDVKIMGKVEGVLSDGGRLTTEQIYWRNAEWKLYTPPGVKVTIIYKDSTIVGEELEAYSRLETVKLKNVTGITRVEEKESEKAAD